MPLSHWRRGQGRHASGKPAGRTCPDKRLQLGKETALGLGFILPFPRSALLQPWEGWGTAASVRSWVLVLEGKPCEAPDLSWPVAMGHGGSMSICAQTQRTLVGPRAMRNIVTGSKKSGCQLSSRKKSLPTMPAPRLRLSESSRLRPPQQG